MLRDKPRKYHKQFPKRERQWTFIDEQKPEGIERPLLGERMERWSVDQRLKSDCRTWTIVRPLARHRPQTIDRTVLSHLLVDYPWKMGGRTDECDGGVGWRGVGGFYQTMIIRQSRNSPDGRLNRASTLTYLYICISPREPAVAKVTTSAWAVIGSHFQARRRLGDVTARNWIADK